MSVQKNLSIDFQVKEIQKHVLLLKSFEDAADKFTGEQAHRLGKQLNTHILS